MSSPRTESEAPANEGLEQSTYIRDLPDRERMVAIELLQACEKADVKGVARLMTSEHLPSVSLRDQDGWTALHYATASGSIEVVELLLSGGALWAMTDHLGYVRALSGSDPFLTGGAIHGLNFLQRVGLCASKTHSVPGQTAGDVAFSMNHKAMYDLLCDHGFRAEMLRRVLDSKISQAGDNSMRVTTRAEAKSASDNTAYLASRLTYKTSSTGQAVCVDSEGNGVMLGWEDEIMRQTADLLCGRQQSSESFELSVLNVGFGLGLIDSYLQTHRPYRHVIVEPHPDVLRFMEEEGWHLKPGVEIYRGRWQTFFDEVEAGIIAANFDAIYWDTFSENYDDLKEVFDRVFNMLSGPTSRLSWFHGLGATSVTLYEIYTRIAELDLREAGFKTIWHDVKVEGGEAVWEGIKRRYWNLPTPYKLPICMYDM